MAMTLEHVRDWHRNRADGIRKGCTTGCSSKHDRMADAIDAHLSAQAKVRVTADAVNAASLAYNDSIEKTHDGFDLPWCDEDAMRAALESFAAPQPK